VDLAEACQVQQAILALNGDMVRLGPLPAAVVGQVRTGRLALDGTQLMSLESENWKNRRRITFNGAAVATVVLDRNGALLADPRVTLQGLGEPDAQKLAALGADVGRAVEELSSRERKDDAAVSDAARIAVRRRLKAWSGKRPVTDVHVVRV
jgi:ribonuclease J